MSTEMVERVARALCRVDLRGDLSYEAAARAAIAAMRVPTEEMLELGYKYGNDYDGGLCLTDAWDAMIDAALAE